MKNRWFMLSIVPVLLCVLLYSCRKKDTVSPAENNETTRTASLPRPLLPPLPPANTTQKVSSPPPPIPIHSTVPFVQQTACLKEVPIYGALLTGGWSSENGTHTFLLLAVSPTSPASKYVQITGRFLTIAETELMDPSWAELVTPDLSGRHVGGAIYTANQLSSFQSNYASEWATSQAFGSYLLKPDQPETALLANGENKQILCLLVKNTANEDTVSLAVNFIEYAGIELPKE